ncbi:S-layer homology domain-containing protein [Alkalihalobacillus oceani]|uniref:S-layer homology domain-containing protein n=1 Tax=Halalkalibacter oceani TaxID=1653776 RepID=A0A9X2DM44_9BACI|nr:S-layer homology domain-containing protein [Halalkalibacter oceani]MCM3712485.1 S-layer homology domain-containing protein [Halalkalibacter oceani]
MTWGEASAKIGLPSRFEAELNETVILDNLDATYDYYTLTAASDYDINIINVRSRADSDFLVTPAHAAVGNIPARVAPAIYLDPDLYVDDDGKVVSCVPPEIVTTPADAAGSWKQEVSVTLQGGACYNEEGDAEYRIQTPDGSWSEWANYSDEVKFDQEGRSVLKSRMSVPGSAVARAEILIDQTEPTIELSADPTTMTNQDVTITADMTDNGAIETKKWAEGTPLAEWFLDEDNGTIFADDSFTVSKNGTFSVFARDEAGNTSVETIEIRNIDKEKPVITLLGDETMSVVRGRSFEDPGATALDNEDGDITSSIVVTGEVDTTTAGEYILYYDVTDEAGNAAEQVTRTVEVTARSSGGGGGGGSGSPAPPANSIPQSGGSLTMEGVTLQLPSGAVSGTTRINVDVVRNTDALPASDRVISDVFEITKDTTESFSVPITLTLPFDPELVDEESSSVSIFWLDEESGEWIELDNIQIDWQDGTVAGEVDHFTKFAVLEVESTEEEEIEEEPSPELPESFTDIDGHWAEEHIMALVLQNIVNGYPDGEFKPNRTLTRAEFTTMIVKAYGIEETASRVFEDTVNHWARESIAAAYEHGLINGYNEATFGADDPITREQVARIIVNASQLAGAEEQSPRFTDQDEISHWAAEAVETVALHGIVTGYPNGSFKPKQTATRAEAVAVIGRVMEEGD